MIEYLIAPNGQYVEELSGEPDEILARTPDGYATTSLPPPRKSDWWNGTEWVAIGSAPAYYFEFDYDSKDWVDTRDLSVVKAKHWENIKLARNKEEIAGFYYNGNKYDSDFISQSRILAIKVVGQPITWTLANSEPIDLTVEEINELFLTLMMHVQALHERGRLAKKAIDMAESNEEVENVLF